jgi:hypothetical protein
MAPKHHPPPLSGGDRKALKKELSKSRAMTRIFAERAEEKRREGEALIREADNLACQSWNERMWSDGGPIDPSPIIDQAINGGLVMRPRLPPPRRHQLGDNQNCCRTNHELSLLRQPWNFNCLS